MQRGHLDDEGEEVVHDGVEELVSHLAPRQVRHRLELVVDEQLRAHHDEACEVHGVVWQWGRVAVGWGWSFRGSERTGGGASREGTGDVKAETSGGRGGDGERKSEKKVQESPLQIEHKLQASTGGRSFVAHQRWHPYNLLLARSLADSLTFSLPLSLFC